MARKPKRAKNKPIDWAALWSRNKSDEIAISRGCTFNVLAGSYAVWWIERYCRLYEGDHAGEQMVLRGLHSQPLDAWEIAPDWDEHAEAIAIARAKAHCEGIHSGELADWQYEVVMRLFGWLKHSEHFGRSIRRFCRGSIWVPKKNKKSPTLAAVGLYLTCGDGEPGNHVYFGAKDGSQAREIAGKHAIEMVNASPELSAECEISLSAMQITHMRSRSTLKPLSSGDDRTQKSKEGINGSVLKDEAHVVDDDFAARVARAGISRAEPFDLDFSTAGRDPDCYGKRQSDYGRQVARGAVANVSYFFAAYEVSQDLSDEQFATDPLKYGRLANPAWDHTVRSDEFLSDYETSKRSISTLADFMTYRCNKWQRSRNPWLRAEKWDACADKFTLEDFKGKPCWAGLDLSKTSDMSAVVLTFEGKDGTYFQLPFFWLPQATAEQFKSDAPFLDWAAAGKLTLTPGEVISQSFIEEWFIGLKSQVRMQGIWFDRTFAYDITERLLRDHGIPRTEFPQTSMMFAGPVGEYERKVIQGKLRHPNHPVLNWQAGHCETYTDSKGRSILVKPPKKNIKKIDGMVAGVMSLHGATTSSAPRSSPYSGRPGAGVFG